ncbi:MAG: hypothetical protein ACXWF8_00840 [Methylobacter sp.]
MKISIHILIGIAFISLAACSTQEVKPQTASAPPSSSSPIVTDGSSQGSNQNPPMTLNKGEKNLTLVRAMDGGACKNDYQGVKGTFLIYADPNDVERVKRDKGTQIFSDFENQIQNFSAQALQEAINETNLAEDPFALSADEAQERLAKQLSNNFRNNIAEAVRQFQQRTTLTIDIVPFAASLFFYQQGCEAASQELENNIK